MRVHVDQAELARVAERIWTTGRGNIPWWSVGTTVGAFETEDRLTWRTTDGAWTAQLRRSKHGQHIYLVLFDEGAYLGRYDARTGWHGATTRSRVRQLRSLPLPLAA